MTQALKRDRPAESGNQDELPDGMRILPLTMHEDVRGSFTEIFREEWPTGVDPVQWNVINSRADTYRGFHVHHAHSDYLIVIQGEMLLGVHDIRPDSATHGQSAMIRLRGDELRAAVIPPGVGHGFYYPGAAVHIYAVTAYWDPATEMGCHWSCPELGLGWPMTDPHISERDAGLGGYDEMVARYRTLAGV